MKRLPVKQFFVIFSRLRKRGEKLLHSKYVVIIVIILTIVDCSLVIAELILDLYSVKSKSVFFRSFACKLVFFLIIVFGLRLDVNKLHSLLRRNSKLFNWNVGDNSSNTVNREEENNSPLNLKKSKNKWPYPRITYNGPMVSSWHSQQPFLHQSVFSGWCRWYHTSIFTLSTCFLWTQVYDWVTRESMGTKLFFNFALMWKCTHDFAMYVGDTQRASRCSISAPLPWSKRSKHSFKSEHATHLTQNTASCLWHWHTLDVLKAYKLAPDFAGCWLN